MQKFYTYIDECNKIYQTGDAREHSYRGFLQTLLKDIINDEKIIIINEPAHIRDVGAPDYRISKNNIPIGYIEAKDIDKSLDHKSYKDQFSRYKNALDNLIFTNYLSFWFYKNAELTYKIDIAKIENGKIVAIEENLNNFADSIKDFTNIITQSIKSPEKLAKLMAGKAKLLEHIIYQALKSDEQTEENNLLKDQYTAFKINLIHDISLQDFADIYAQTIAYGMFVARLHDETLENFSRQEALNLIPKSNPFLRGLFNYISGTDCDERLIWIIDSLAEIFLATDVKKLFDGFLEKTGLDDPVIHFYETFLSEYNPKLRKSRGVWYTPQSVVNFIVRACDEVLKSEFGLNEGLSDESKITIKVDDSNAKYTSSGKLKQKEIQTHKVQILDPATGTGTFLAESIKLIKKDFWGSSWSDYVEKHLIPRLNGFELLMASYAMAHLKLDLLLLETGYKPINQKRFNIYLTNSLEEYNKESENLFASFISNEIKQADKIKKEAPIMVVMGNPPYSGESANKNDYINNLLEDYKKEWNGNKLKEKNPKWLNDDYVKFIRYAESCIEKNKEGILAFITNNSYINNPTFRGMRYHLLKTFDKIYILDLHGNAKKKEVSPDGSKDENVFDIMQGVAIIIAIKKSIQSQKLAKLYTYDLYGTRKFKYKILNENNLKDIEFNEIKYQKPDFYFFGQNYSLKSQYDNGLSISELFSLNSVGIVTARDNLTIKYTFDDVKNTINDFVKLDIEEARIKYKLGKDVRDWKVKFAQEDLKNSNLSFKNIIPISYRPFDTRYTYFTGKCKGFHCMPRGEVMKHFLKDNIGLISIRRSRSNNEWKEVFLSTRMIMGATTISSLDINYFYPLYLYPDENSLDTKRVPNLNENIIKKIEKKLNLKFVSEKQNDNSTFAPIDLFDYIYAILHSPKYRQTYNEFLKIDFPRVPYPNISSFWDLVGIGAKLRKIHLLEDESLEKRLIDIKGEGALEITNKLNKKDFHIADDKVSLNINDGISIINIPLNAWEFYIGGYQPAQKWLKDRVGMTLGRADIKYYNKIINALVRTDELMQEVDKINF